MNVLSDRTESLSVSFMSKCIINDISMLHVVFSAVRWKPGPTELTIPVIPCFKFSFVIASSQSLIEIARET